ncbi:MAG: carbohydrate kinase family protein [Marmoricola sp.]
MSVLPRSVLVVGGANLDLLARSHAALRLHTSNPGVSSGTPGGVGRNIAENLARLGTTTRLVLAVGDDPAGAELLERTQAAGVETFEVPWTGATGTYTAILDADGSLLAGIADMAATASITPEDVESKWIADADWLVLDGNLSPATLAHALSCADDSGVPVALDPVSAPKSRLIAPLLTDARVHTLTPTLDELVALTGDPDPVAGADRLHRCGVEVVWVREGERGSTLFRRDAEPVRVALPKVAAVDVTGAGDAMLAAYVHALLGGADLTRAAFVGAAAAMLTVQSPWTVRPDLSDELVRLTLAAQPASTTGGPE